MKADTSTDARANSGRDRRLEAAAPLAAEPDEAVVGAAADTCASCRFYQARKVYRAAEPLGVCRWLPGGTPMAASGWCGQYKREDS